MLRCRALENKVWIAAADKVGIEAESIVYAGNSCIIDPKGDLVASASSHREEVICASIDTSISWWEGGLDPIKGRRPHTYRLLIEDRERLPVVSIVNGPQPRAGIYVAALQIRVGERIEYYLDNLKDQGAKLVVLP